MTRPNSTVFFSKVVGKEGGFDLCVLVVEVSEASDVMRVMIGYERGILSELRGWHAGEKCAVAPAEFRGFVMFTLHAGMAVFFYIQHVFEGCFLSMVS